jgi:ADP-heptose:LPS heptosyltransferase
MAMLSEFADIEWIGLAPEKNSKHGKNNSLLDEAKRIASADIFLGPEGGLLWLAAGIGKPCVYFSENIDAVAQRNGFTNLNDILGSKNYHSRESIHIALPSHCSNQEAIELIKQAISSLK